MSTLTNEQKQRYIDDGAQYCPFCGSDQIYGGYVQTEAGVCWQEVMCPDCDETWNDVYTLTSVDTTDEYRGRDS